MLYIIQVYIYKVLIIKFKIMIFSNLRHDNWWSRDNFLNQIKDADETCRSSEISVDLIIIIVFV